jgi:hypothetical protein
MALSAEWELLYGSAPPDKMSPDLLARGIAWKQQALSEGGVDPATSRELDRLAAQLDRSGDLDLERQMSLRAGTRLVREWHGRICRVLVLEEGFEFDGERYASLSQIARTITGTQWSGPRFFGLTQRRRASTDG